jgi:6-phosphogluconolactonase (cycloisomerase 2 family)
MSSFLLLAEPGQFLRRLHCRPPITIDTAAGIALDLENDRLFFTDIHHARISAIQLSSETELWTHSKQTVVAGASGQQLQVGHMVMPCELSLNCDKNLLYVNDFEGGCVMVFDAATGVLRFTFQPEFLHPPSMREPQGLVASSVHPHRVWIALGHCVRCYDVSALVENPEQAKIVGVQLIGQQCFTGDVDATNAFNSPDGLASHSGWLFVADRQNSRVVVFDEVSTSFVCSLRPGAAAANFHPHVLTIDRTRNILYVASAQLSVIHAFRIGDTWEHIAAIEHPLNSGATCMAFHSLECELWVSVCRSIANSSVNVFAGICHQDGHI